MTAPCTHIVDARPSSSQLQASVAAAAAAAQCPSARMRLGINRTRRYAHDATATSRQLRLCRFQSSPKGGEEVAREDIGSGSRAGKRGEQQNVEDAESWWEVKDMAAREELAEFWQINTAPGSGVQVPEEDEYEVDIQMHSGDEVSTDEVAEEGADIDQGDAIPKDYVPDNDVLDTVTNVFWESQAADWDRLLAGSSLWDRISKVLLERAKAKAGQIENPDERLERFRFVRRLQSASEKLARNKAVLREAEIADGEDDLARFVASRGENLNEEFFCFVGHRCASLRSERLDEEADKLLELSSKISAVIEVQTSLEEDTQALASAQETLAEIFNSETLQQAEKKIDDLSLNRQMDPALLMLMAKAYTGSKESPLVRDEAKDIMAHLYMRAKENMGKTLPKEVRILKHIMTFDSPKDRIELLGEAFTPGPELDSWSEKDPEDRLYTTPQNMLVLIEKILRSYRGQNQTLILSQMLGTLSPSFVDKLVAIQDEITRYYL